MRPPSCLLLTGTYRTLVLLRNYSLEDKVAEGRYKRFGHLAPDIMNS